ncbi:MAG: hypothetical protein JO189_13000 [Deltaproteobacteria bacterium]|nr:hypothetical protein [Deltaproteobacteria bacterium]
MFQLRDMKYAAIGVNLVELQAACFRHEGRGGTLEGEAMVASLVAAALGRLDETLYVKRGKMRALAIVDQGGVEVRFLPPPDCQLSSHASKLQATADKAWEKFSAIVQV